MREWSFQIDPELFCRFIFLGKNAVDRCVGNFQNEIKTVSQGNKAKIT